MDQPAELSSLIFIPEEEHTTTTKPTKTMYDLFDVAPTKKNRSGYVKAYSSAHLLKAYRAVTEMPTMDSETCEKKCFEQFELSVDSEFKAGRIDELFRWEVMRYNYGGELKTGKNYYQVERKSSIGGRPVR